MTDYEIIYHVGFSGRAMPVIHLLLEAGLTYTLVAPSWGADRCVTPNPGHPVFAPPVLKKGDFHLAQTSAIMQYLGAKHGFAPADAEVAASCSQVTMDAADVLAETLNQKKEADKGEKFFSEGGRFSSWAGHFDRILQKSGGPYLFGAEPTFADFALFSTMESLYFNYKEKCLAVMPDGFKSWLETMESRPSTVAYRALNMPNLPESFRI